MEYYRKLEILLTMKNHLQKRQQHIRQERKVDEMLHYSAQKCPKLVLQFLFKERKIRRYLATKTYNSTILEYPDRIKYNLDIADALYGKHTEFTCKMLPEVMSKMDTVLKDINSNKCV